MDNKDFVNEEVCAERHKNANNKIETIQADLKDKEERTRKIEALTVQMGEILKNHESKIQNHDERIVALESRPIKFWDKILYLLIGAMATGLVSTILQHAIK